MASETQVPAPEAISVKATGNSKLNLLLPLLVLLIVAMTLVWYTRPKEAGVYSMPPLPVKSVKEVQSQIDAVKKNKNIPEAQKPRILGFLQIDLEKAKTREANPVPAK